MIMTSTGLALIAVIIVFFITLLLVAFWTWFITKVVIVTREKHIKKYGLQELEATNALLVAIIELGSRTTQTNIQLENIAKKLDNLNANNSPH